MSSQLWAVNTLGGYFYSLNLSDELRQSVQTTTKFRQFADVKDASQQGKKKGDTFTWDVVSNIATQGNALTETNTMPESNFTITQGTLTITEYGNSIPYSGKLEDLGKFSVKDTVMKVLKNDTTKVMDCAAHQQFNRTPLRVVPTGGTSTTAVTLTTNGTATLTNNVAFNKDHAKSIIDTMKERNIPAYTGDDYFALAWPSTYRTFKNNLESLHQYTDRGLTMIMNGEVGRYEGCRYVEQTNIVKGGAANSTTYNTFTNTADAWDNAASDWIFFFGEDTVAEGIAVPEEVRAKVPTDYGRSKGVAWYSLNGFGLVHTAQDQARVIKWDSAA
ncbi:MAG: N4-gp56 family major capsid protein [Polaromonas sp.]|nr:N4-gp56 family major capsid protein [Polaromonas sp.]